ncbi:MAG: thioredoxin-dependent thiol peroxidase [Flavobacteriaceae bacterium]|nr:thioredoxin-dependent thiol peroxidase [Flavobacteriaceae bacterium]
MKLLNIGDKIPNFECYDYDGNLFTEKNLLGKKTIIFFYPKANTPGCTAQACNLSDNYTALENHGYSVIGVSADKVDAQQKFSLKYGGFKYPLLSDIDKKMINSFGVWGLKKFMGKEYMGIIRTTFIVDRDLKILRIIDKVKTKDHTNQILSE